VNLAAIQRAPPEFRSEEDVFRLPVCGRLVALRSACGAEDLILLTADGGETRLALELATRLTRHMEGLPLDWGRMCATDLDAFVLHLRRMRIGDAVRSDVECATSDCRQRIDISFTISEFLAHHSPASPGSAGRGWTLKPADESGWYGLSRKSGPTSIEFRLPTPDDQLAVAGRPDAEGEMARRCLRPAGAPARLRRRAEAVMEKIAPSLSNDLIGACPACGMTMAVYFDARGYCVRELRNHAAFIYEDIDLLARRYHWPEQEILSLPTARRSAYAELARRRDDTAA
jgi:hypothetical protein